MTTIDLDANLADLSSEDFKSYFDDYLDTSNIKEQSVVKGNVIAVEGDWVTVDVGYKAEGRIPLHQFKDENGIATIAVGDKVDVFLGNMSEEDGELQLSKEKADLMKAWDEVAKAVEANETVNGVVVARVKGGLSVNIGVKAFLPGSQVDLRPVKNLDKLIGEAFDFRIIKFNKRRGNIVLSRRVLLEEERESKRMETVGRLRVGAIMNGVIKNITDYGAFVDLGGIDGLLHITDMSYGRINHPSEMFEVGQTIEVKVLKFDADSQRVSLGYKQMRPDPWDEVDYKYPVGSIVRGKVVSIPDYGAFIELEDGIEGLVHISEMTWNKRVKHPSKLVAIADVVEAQVLGIDMENKRISLGMRQLEENPWDRIEDRYPVGIIVKGKVRNITDFGIFVGIEDGIDGLVHISDLSWGQRLRHPSDRFQKGDEVEARVLNIDRYGERFSLGIKQLTEDPWLSAQGRYFLGQVLEGPIVHVADFGVFVELEDGVEGLVHVSELSHSDGDWQGTYAVGTKLAISILNIDSHDRKISLSQAGSNEEVSDGNEVRDVKKLIAKQGTPGASLGDLMGHLDLKMQDETPADEAPAEENAEAPVEAPVSENSEASAEESSEAPVETPTTD